MEIKKTIKLNLEQKGKELICYDLTTLQLVLGTASVVGNYAFYKVQVLENPKRFKISIDEIKNRIKVLKRKQESIQNRIEIMEQLI